MSGPPTVLALTADKEIADVENDDENWGDSKLSSGPRNEYNQLQPGMNIVFMVYDAAWEEHLDALEQSIKYIAMLCMSLLYCKIPLGLWGFQIQSMIG